MKSSVEDEYLQSQFNESRSLDDFLASVNDEARTRVNTVYTHKGDNEQGDVTLIGGVHGGTQTVEAVENIIEKRNPEHVAVELGPIQYQLVKLFKPHSTNLELAVGIFEGEKRGAKTHPIDIHRVWMRCAELIHGSSTTRLTALLTLVKHTAGMISITTALLFFIFGFAIAGILSLIIGIWIFWHQLTQFQRDPYREYDYALITIITSASKDAGKSTIHHDLTRKRDSHMAEEIKRIRSKGDVVAIVGYNHLDGIRKRIDEDESSWNGSNFDL